MMKFAIKVFIILLVFVGCKEKHPIEFTANANIEYDTIIEKGINYDLYAFTCFNNQVLNICKVAGDDSIIIRKLNESGQFFEVNSHYLKDTTLFTKRANEVGDNFPVYQFEFLSENEIFVILREYDFVSSSLWFTYNFQSGKSQIIHNYQRSESDRGIADNAILSKGILLGDSFLFPMVNEGSVNYSFAKMSLRTGEKRIIHLPLPDEYKFDKKTSYPFETNITMTQGKDNSIFIMFGMSKSIYQIDENVNLINKFVINSPFYKTSIPYSAELTIGDDFVRVAELTYHNCNLAYNPKTKEYLLFYALEMQEKNEEGLMNIFPDDKEYGMCIMDSVFHVKGDYFVGKGLVADAVCFEKNRFFPYADMLYKFIFNFEKKLLVRITLKNGK